MLIAKNPKLYEQYLTKDSIAKECIDQLENFITFDEFSTILEPASGEGAFLEQLPEHKKIVYIDIDAKDKKHRKDFLIDKIKITQPCLTVGNPPFKKASQFFNKAAKFSDVIAFILPASYNKFSMQNKLDTNFYCIYTQSLPKDAFIFENDDYDVPSVFQIWCHKDLLEYKNPRPIFTKILETNDFKFVGTNDKFDLIIRRNGVYAGRMYTQDLDRWTSQNHYFIQIKGNKKEVINKLKLLDLENCQFKCGKYPSISKTELCYLYINFSKN